ncbi:MAG: MBL fold metallo-hydrolase [Thermoanaerobaculia bacterium]|nr:MBL fold metallo-hydrolase [Thermoanaerobaculia bacterium]
MAVEIHPLDLDFQGTPQTIASFLVRGPDGVALVETGPGSTLRTLRRRLAESGVEEGEVRAVLVTHIHLDHAGAAGWWARRGATVYVHPRGAPHLVDPSRLLRSATRIYGDRMDVLWGETVPAPADRVVAVEDGEEVSAAGLTFQAVETPGHARHHHVWRLGRVLFSGDAAGIRLPGESWIDLPAPPPEFDLEAWKESLARIRGLGARTLYRTHFGPTTEVAAELDAFEASLEETAEFVGRMVREGASREEMLTRYGRRVRELASEAGVDETAARAYEVANPREMSVDGIARYWNQRGEA